VVGERLEFWSPLADEEGRPVAAQLAVGPVPVQVPRDDLSALVDALLGNVFAHTPEGTGFTVRLDGRAGGGARLLVIDGGPGLPETVLLRRGHSGAGSTGLGLDIVQRTAAASGGGLTLERSPGGGSMIAVELGPPPDFPPARRGAAHRRASIRRVR
jgi:signal transduction histidine kinase